MMHQPRMYILLGYNDARHCSRTLSRMTSPAAKGFPKPERVCGKDERVQVNPMTSPPYKWICYLLIESVNGQWYKGSGFKIHLPDVNHTAVVTSGHCTYVEGQYANQIIVIFPEEQAVPVGPNDIYASPEYIATSDEDHDYGLILLPGTSYDGFGWSAIIPDEELNNRLVTNCGYPGDKPERTMWVTGGPIETCTAKRIWYMNDTMGGQSGSPVYTWYGGYWTVVAVHSYGGCPNSAPRFTVEMISRFLERMDGLKKKSLESVKFSNVYLRCNGKEVTQWKKRGGGTVDCQFGPPKKLEMFYIYPVEIAPSLPEPQTTYKVVIESAESRHVFIRMNGQGMDQPMGPGGGEVNCQFAISSSETYFLKKETNGYSFRNVQFPQCYIRLDGTGIKKGSTSGGGTVNCQYYHHLFLAPSSWERFHLNEH